MEGTKGRSGAKSERCPALELEEPWHESCQIPAKSLRWDLFTTAFGTRFLLPSWEASGQTNGIQSEIAKGESQCQRDKFLMGHAVALSGTL